MNQIAPRRRQPTGRATQTLGATAARTLRATAALVLAATATLALAAPAQAAGEVQETPPPVQEQVSPFVTVVTCDLYVLVFPNEFDAELWFSLTPNQDTTAGNAPDFVPLLEAERDEGGFIEVPQGAGLEAAEAVGAGETIGPLGPVAPGGARGHGFEASAGLEITIEVTAGGEPVAIDTPVASFDEDAQGLECAPADGGEGGALPVTGSATLLVAGGALALLALGGGLFLIARRRRVTFTA